MVLIDVIRTIVDRHGGLSVAVVTLTDCADLYAAGLQSLAIPRLMIAIEERFGIELPDEMLSRRTFASIAAMAEGVRSVQEARQETAAT